MDRNKQYIAVVAVCLSIILAGAIIAYKPGVETEKENLFSFPTGIPPSLGTSAYTGTNGDSLASTISVTGSGSASAQANKATVVLGVQTEKPYASEAVDENAVLMNEVIAAIKALGFTEEDIQTVSYNVYSDYDWDLKRVVGYRVTNMIKVDITNLDLVGDVIDAAVGAGANRVEGVSFELTDELADQLKMDAYVSALNDARAKADVIAETLGIEITGVHSVSESVYYPYTPYRSYATAEYAGAAPTPIIEGALSVSVTVHIVYTFQ